MYDIAKKLSSDYLPVAAKVASFVLKNLPGTNEDVKVLCNLTGTLLSDIKQTEIGWLQFWNFSELNTTRSPFLGRQFFLDEFVPIGNFFVLQPDALSTLTPDATTPQVQEAILKETLRSGLEDIMGGHSLEKYYCAHITSLYKLPLHRLNKVDTKNLLQATQSRASALVRKGQNSEYSFALMVRGSFLQIQMGSDQNDFSSVPLTARSTATVSTVSLT